jgi:chemotaxis family two-component system response regulator Rcp1
MNFQEYGKPIDILLIEDNPGDIRLTMEAFKEGKFYNNLYVAKDGEDAIHFLRRKGKYSNVPKPDLILLDLNLPKKDGRQVLKEIKSDHELKRIPVIILTISKTEQDILQTNDLHANCYINKPVDVEEFITIIRSIENFWISIVKLPEH